MMARKARLEMASITITNIADHRKNNLASLGRKRPHEDKITISHLYRK